VEGAGTTAGKADDTAGKAFGSGSSGIVKRVLEACEKSAKKIAKIAKNHPKLKSKDEPIKVDILAFDVFGFSRGSAAARHFVHEINKPEGEETTPTGKGSSQTKKIARFGKLGEVLEGEKILVDHLVIRFLGIYDTVSSFASINPGTWGFGNDVQDLSLDDIGMSKKMVHFTAADEHREYFSLTTARSNNDGKASELRFVEKMLPGAHSDIGGSYVDEMNEKASISTTTTSIDDGFSNDNVIQKMMLEKNQLVEDGWYKLPEENNPKNKIEFEEHRMGNRIKYTLIGKRTLSNKYSFIPLHFMFKLGTESEVPFKGNIEGRYSIAGHELLERAKGKLEGIVFGGEPKWAFSREDQFYKDLRAEYLHWSAVLVIGKTARIEDGKRVRAIIDGTTGSDTAGKVIGKKPMG
jgi:hypothetical protein